mmetsp:Transcript_15210/g.59466  ORF Transcript_15210/g.59466 Transcript_15210/m.59466 type:complete len:271 (-) Transcript_15210:442-1254(-)
MKPTPWMNFRTVVTGTPLAMSESASVPANTPDAAMVAQGNAEKYDDLASSKPITCLKYKGIHARRMKYPQLLTKLATMHAHTGALLSRSRNGVGSDILLVTPSSLKVESATLPPSSINASSRWDTLGDSLGYVVAANAHTTAHSTPERPNTAKGPDTPPHASMAGAASKPTMDPLWNPPMHAATARDRSALGTHRAVRLFMHGSATPSPRPMTARVSSSAGRLVAAASGVAIVASDQTSMPPPSTALPPYLSASTPPRRGVSMYPHRNDD